MGSLGDFIVRLLKLCAQIIGHLVVGYVFGPPAAVNRWFLQRAKANLDSRRMRWIEVDAIAAAWTGPAVAFVLLALVVVFTTTFLFLARLITPRMS